jgi:uncharacterized membrane protein YjjB (DUF3815 family)
MLNPDYTIQLISCTIGCIGFGWLFNVKGKQIVFCGIGAFFTWLIYIIAFARCDSNFISTMIASIFVAAYAQIMARINKAPATIFLSVCAFPLIPGQNLYYTMYWLVMDEHAKASSEAMTLLITCLGIALGFILIEIINKYAVLIWGDFKRWRKGGEKKRTGSY